MEWQLVTGSFEGINRKGDSYPNPDPSDGNKAINFCKYFIATFHSNKRFTLGTGTTDLTANQHMAAAFPSRKHNVEEFVWLVKDMNSPAKSNVCFPIPDRPESFITGLVPAYTWMIT